MEPQPYSASITEFLHTAVPPRLPIIGKWLATGELCMLFAPTGEGKSFYAASTAHAAATGGVFLGFKAARAFRVAYVEAEMSAASFQTRLRQIDDAAEVSADPRNFLIVRRSLETNFLPNIQTPEGARQMLRILHGYDLIIIDNLTTAAPPVTNKDDDVQIWHRVRDFLFKLRERGQTVILVHHAGKSGLQLGTSLRENDMDTIIRLRKPIKPLNAAKLSMEIEMVKARSMDPADRIAIYAEFCIENDRATWTSMLLAEARRLMVIDAARFMKNRLLISTCLKVPLLEVMQILDSAQEPAPVLPRGDAYDEDTF